MRKWGSLQSAAQQLSQHIGENLPRQEGPLEAARVKSHTLGAQKSNPIFVRVCLAYTVMSEKFKLVNTVSHMKMFYTMLD